MIGDEREGAAVFRRRRSLERGRAEAKAQALSVEPDTDPVPADQRRRAGRASTTDAVTQILKQEQDRCPICAA